MYLKCRETFRGTAMSRIGVVALLCSGLALAGCGLSRVVPDTPATAYSMMEFSYAAGGRDLRTVIQGNPFVMDKAAFDRAVTDLMQGKHFGPPTRFTTTPDDSAMPPYKAVMVFNPVQVLNNNLLCTDQEIPTRPPGGPITVQAAFCRGGTLTSANGFAPAQSGPDTSVFRSLITDLTFFLVPARNPTTEDHDNCFGPIC